MFHLFMILTIANATPKSNPAEVTACLTALGQYEFGQKYPGAKEENLPIVQKVPGGGLISWNGKQMRQIPSGAVKAVGVSSDDSSAVDRREKKGAPGKVIWTETEGRVDNSFPSQKLEEVQRLFVADSFNSFIRQSKRRNDSGKTYMTSSMRQSVLGACENIVDVSLARYSKSVGQIAKQMKANQPLRPAPRSGQGTVAQ